MRAPFFGTNSWLHEFLKRLPRNLLHYWTGCFVWIPTVKKKPERATKNKARQTKSDAKIFATEELFIGHPNFLRVLASFLVQSFAIDFEQGVEAANLLGVTSDDGGLCHGPTQKHEPRDKIPRVVRGSKGIPGGKKGQDVAETAFAMAIPQMSQLPGLKEESIIATTLGRQRRGKVIGTQWHGISAAVKIIYMDSNDDYRQYAQDLFRMEVEAKG